MTSQAMKDVLSERLRQVSEEGFTSDHDDHVNTRSELTKAAVCMAMHSAGKSKQELLKYWPPGWAIDWFKSCKRRRLLVKAAALLIAEIERLDRLQEKNKRSDV